VTRRYLSQKSYPGAAAAIEQSNTKAIIFLMMHMPG
jgi:hypothetical protein